jgi:hypothetical protein
MAGSPKPTTHAASVRPRKWDVIHACDNARQVAELLDAQACANIRAYIVSRPRPAHDSLLQSWNEIRKWSSLLSQHVGEPPFDSAGLIVHAHSFNAGMAGIRGEVPCVYDLSRFIEQISPEVNRAWLGRSFRAAEQFVLTQTAAIVVHDPATQAACASRGIPRERVFRIPHAAPLMPDENPGRAFRQRLAISSSETTIFSELMDAPLAVTLLTESSLRPLRLLLTENASAQMSVLSQRDQLAQFSVSLSRDHHEAAIAASDLVIGQSEDVIAIAMTHGKPSLASDNEEVRSLSPDGAGITWCDVKSPQDRARRLAFLLKDREMRDSLGAAARRFIASARSLERVGKMYEEVYRFAAEARKPGKQLPPNGTLIPVSADLS